MLNKLSLYLLVALILSFGFGQLLRFEIFGIPLFVHDALALSLLITQCLTISSKQYLKLINDFKAGKHVGLVLLLIGLVVGGINALTIYQASLLAVPLLYSLRLLLYISLYLVLKIRKISIPANIYISTGFIGLTIGMLQYFLLPDMRIFENLGWDDHLNRLTLPHFDPTFSGVMLVLIALTTLNLKSIYKLPLLVFSMFGVLLTYARSVWLSVVMLGLMFIRNKIILLTFLGILVVGIIALPKRFGEGNNLLRTYSITSRIESDVIYVKKYKWDLIIGRGMNTLVLDAGESEFDNHATSPNNSFLYLLVTTGLLGLMGWIIFLYSIYTNSKQKSAIIFIIIASLFNNVMFYPFALLWIFLADSMVPSEA